MNAPVSLDSREAKALHDRLERTLNLLNNLSMGRDVDPAQIGALRLDLEVSNDELESAIIRADQRERDRQIGG